MGKYVTSRSDIPNSMDLPSEYLQVRNPFFFISCKDLITSILENSSISLPISDFTFFATSFLLISIFGKIGALFSINVKILSMTLSYFMSCIDIL